MAESTAARPVGPAERILALDVLRGFAMFGVLVAYCMWSLGTAPEESWTRLDQGIADFIGFAVDGKFYTILAFLFGLGFSIQLTRAPDEGAAVSLYRRRLAVLAAIGLAHALLLRNSDILFPYAVIGFLLIPFRRSSNRMLLAAACAALLVSPAARSLWELSGRPLPQRPQLENAPYLVENFAWVIYWLKIAVFTWPESFTLFLFGFCAGRNRLVALLASRPRTLAAIVLAGLGIGTIFYLLSAKLSAGAPTAFNRPLAGIAFDVHCWGMSSAYAAALVLALGSRAGAACLSPLATIGRLALTNYLMQAAVIVPLCLAFGWFDTFTPARSILLAFAVFLLVQIPFGTLWLRHFQFGPAEWAWRSLTYGRAPLLKASADYASI
jgi:uncharacterized protein